MRKRQIFGHSNLDVWEEFWAGIQSELAGQQLATRSQATRPSMDTTIIVTAPRATVTVSTTLYSTTFVTVMASPEISSGLPASNDSSTLPIWSSSKTISSTSSSTSGTITMSSRRTALPSVIVINSPTELPLQTGMPLPTTAPAVSNSTADAATGGNPSPDSQKRAIVGGLSGTIAGLILIGALVCVILRIRRKKPETHPECNDSLSEKSFMPPAFVRTWTGLSNVSKGTVKQPTEVIRQLSPAAVDEDHRMIRMNTRHWPRPFAPGEGVGWRESLPPGQLRVVNPDLSRPVTPRRSPESAAHFLRRQRSSLSGFVFGVNTPHTSVQSQQHPPNQPQIPTITIIDPNLSRECVATYAATPSFRSYPSVSVLPIIVQQPPDDPFYTSSVASIRIPEEPESTESHKQTPRSRPGLDALQTAAGAAGRTWSHLSSQLLHPLRSRANSGIINPHTPVQDVRGLSHLSYSSSESRHSRRSDPFDLDQPSIRGSHNPPELRIANEFQRRNQTPNWRLYEGT